MVGKHRFRERLAAGQYVVGPVVNFNSPWFVDMMGLTGFDFVVLDAEHGPMSPTDVEMMMRAAEAGGMSALVRVPGNVPHEILRYLDIGAVGVQVPHIDSATEAKDAVAASRYPPVGIRGLAGTTRAANYGLSMTTAEYADMANSEVIVLAMVESAASVQNLDEILEVKGIDAIVLGPTDLSVSMGFKGDVTRPEVQKAVDTVIKKARGAGKWVSLPATDGATARTCISRGANIVMLSPAAFLRGAAREFHQTLRG